MSQDPKPIDLSAIVQAKNEREATGNGVNAARASRGALLMNGDEQHDPLDLLSLIYMIDERHDAAVGARDARSFPNGGQLAATRVLGHKILGLVSGLRTEWTDLFHRILCVYALLYAFPTAPICSKP